MDTAIHAARNAGADIIVDKFNDPIGKDAIIQWPGGLNMQLYCHTIPPSYPLLETIPDNRVYMFVDKVNDFIRAFLQFSHGKVVSDDPHADASEIGRPGETFRRIRITSGFGNMLIFVTDGHLPYPFGREITGYEVADLNATLTKALGTGVKILSAPNRITLNGGEILNTSVVQFPGGYIAEIHDYNASPKTMLSSFQNVNYTWFPVFIFVVLLLALIAIIIAQCVQHI